MKKLLLAPLLALAAATPSGAAAPGELEDALAAVREVPVSRVWALADELWRGHPADLARSCDARLVAGGLEPRQVLLLAGVRLQEPQPDMARIAGHLRVLLGHGDEDVAAAAADLLADPAFKVLPAEALAPLLADLTRGARDAARGPRARLACAVALTRVGGGKERRLALDEMRAFLDSSDVRLRTLGALALARGGDVETGIGELERLAALPGPSGRLASAYLAQEDTRRLWDRKIKNDREQYEARMSAEETKHFPELEKLQGILKLIRDTHLIGDRRDTATLVDAALAGMLRSLERGAAWLTGDEVRRWYQGQGTTDATDIGAIVVADPYDGLLTLTRVAVGGPAWRAGFKPGDKIVRIDQWPTLGRPTSEGMLRLRGEPGTVRRIYVWRRGMDFERIDRPTPDMAVELTLAPAAIPPVAAELLPGDVGLLEVRVFQPGTGEALADAVRRLSAAGAQRFVLDLRSSTGDDVEAAAEVADMLLPPELLVVKTESRVEDTRQFFTKEPPLVPAEAPVAVLVDRLSSPAAEILAGALQDHDRSELFGAPTPGTGTVKRLVRLPGEADDLFDDANGNGRYDPNEEITRDWDGDGQFDYAPRALLSISRYLRPSGKPIRRQLDETGEVVAEGGVDPDHTVAPVQWEPWQLEEVRRIESSGLVRAWVARSVPADSVRDLAVDDGDDSGRYPGLSALHEELRTPLALDDVRRLAREEVRRRASELGGPPRPEADFQEDRQLQAAVSAVLEAAGLSYRDFEAYARTFDLDVETTAAGDLIAAKIPNIGRDKLADAVSDLERALQGDRRLSKDELRLLSEILSSALDGK